MYQGEGVECTPSSERCGGKSCYFTGVLVEFPCVQRVRQFSLYHHVCALSSCVYFTRSAFIAPDVGYVRSDINMIYFTGERGRATLRSVLFGRFKVRYCDWGGVGGT